MSVTMQYLKLLFVEIPFHPSMRLCLMIVQFGFPHNLGQGPGQLFVVTP